MMKKVALFGGLLALLGVSAAFAAGQFPGYPVATSSPITGNAVTLPLSGNETIPADTNLTQTLPGGTVVGSIQPQTELITTSQLRAYVLSGSSVSTYIKLPLSTTAALPTCAAALNGVVAAVSDGTAYAVGVYGAAATGGGIVTRQVICTNTAGAAVFAWAYN